MVSKARKKNAQGQIASEFCDPQACGKDGQAITLLPTIPEPSPPLVLAEGEGLWGNLMLTRCPAPGVEKGKAHFPGWGGTWAGTQAPHFHVDCLWAKRIRTRK